ncbi:MAG: Rpn family recombination-promoting nuclease/putative transposase [Hymenobacteraceae bacterium]|nr:Rpn family recombination-promoting nuclease/putative transposase [Hymenobacteraceae bacterium]
MRYLDPKNDLTFKKVFGQHPHLLQSFLNALLPLEEGQLIESLEYLPADMVPPVPGLKNSIVDVRCTDNFGRQFIVEMQMLWTDSFKSRVLFNASKAYVTQLRRGGAYEALQPVYALSLVDQIFEPTSAEYYHHYRFVHTLEPEKRLEGLELIFVELPKFAASRMLGKRMHVLWLRYMTEIRDQSEQIPTDLLVEPDLEEAVEYLRESAFTSAELLGYDQYWDAVSSERTRLNAALREGREEGREEGLTEGIEQGKQAATRELVRRLLAVGVSPTAVAEATGLTEREIGEMTRS